MNFEYECALTGVTAEGGIDDDSDGLGELPVGWTRIHMSRRQYNPKWALIQQLKEVMAHQLLSQMPPEVAQTQQYPILVQVEAQFHSLESSTPIYTSDVNEIVYLSDTGEIAETLNELRDLVGLPPIPEDDEEEEEEEEDE